ncbi:iron-sulfur cluster biosynthesis family protein [Bacillus sp. 31A1R]|uniref:Iron-sulfur cluster biosynthesis family protein n=1 Tax=Robertmurraya mangrovi TaxID=3098077 RepID=A0ABU5IWD8_9BACI|nr:iron-sulfur cluster biosynthesis family protein [Bacillus sp. 31A1R]MDZ5471450.1 iron-sulfur cluster biosynthesis family protein [Bacillus sp. 31A1R]
MEIVIKPAALEQLKRVEFQEDEGLRIEAIFVGSCSLYAEHDLRIDKKGEEDELFIVEEIPVLISKESQKHLSDKIILDFNPTLGYKISSNEEVYRYNLQLKKFK